MSREETKRLGQLLFFELARMYPITPVSVSAYEELKRGFSSESELVKQLWPTRQAARSHAEEIFKRLGREGNHRAFALGLADAEPFDRLRSLPLDDLKAEQIVALLETAEWFVGVREYPQAHAIFSHLMTLQKMPQGIERDRLIFLYARSCNAMNDPSRAATNYRRLFTDFPKSTFAAQARRNYILSLHYSRKHKEAIAEIVSLNASQRKFADSLQWQRFWSLYLAGSLDAAELLARSRIGSLRKSDERQKYLYWLARILEKKKKHAEAMAVYEGFDDDQEQSSYSILARWRGNLVKEGFLHSGRSAEAAKEVSLQAKQLIDRFGFVPAKQLSGSMLAENVFWNSELVSAFHLLRVGMGNFARSLLRRQSIQKLTHQQVAALATLAVASHDYSLASQLGKRALTAHWPRIKHSYVKKFELLKTEKSFEYPLAFDAIIRQVAAELDLDASLIYAVMKAESHYDPDVTSWVGARGLMQIMPGTGARISKIIGFKDYHPDMLYQPELNIALGAWYLKRLLVYYRGDLIRAIAAYNAGPEAVDRWARQTSDLEIDEYAENIPFGQTHAYVRKVLGFMDSYYRIYSGRASKGSADQVASGTQTLPNPKSPDKTVASARDGLVLRLSPQLAAPDPDMEMF